MSGVIGYVVIRPISQRSYVFIKYITPKNIHSVEIEDNCLLITPDEYIGLISKQYMFNKTLSGLVDYVEPQEQQGE